MASWKTRKNEREIKTHRTEWNSLQSYKVIGGGMKNKSKCHNCSSNNFKFCV